MNRKFFSMKLLEYKIQINAPAEKVWEVLFSQNAEENWPSAINEGTYFEGTWEEGSIMRFLDAENNGMFNLIEKNIPKKELKMKHLGWIYDGELSPQDWQDATVTYLLESNENGTFLTAIVNSLEEFVDFFNSKYPPNFENIKKLSESLFSSLRNFFLNRKAKP